jgi:hypothetical protein
MGQNIDQVDDNEYMAVTEAMAVFGEEIEQRGSRTWLGISLAEDGCEIAALGGRVSPEALDRLEALLTQLRVSAQDVPDGEPVVLHLSPEA